ncbi:hypothetical protein Pmar_PMAR027025 [Perkinsus marinus ATCC 50983]|uniref:Uncharacterized protein n=2 Tax=Perkinsus marinus (strain ATCC 50983 / TXsc) TaxID=423536 RepID=C5KVZ7_PERM5|nr:hypothetical protein Pmar_PMAR027025 [Perkinsus marinus ATCC 50983]EER11346.1 hypothetical protein Pmar_PMAR027025 [Perkinsus marinus ATCC 50983]|eukprot:XP_002779551.1 hypothetical protein Pmar_PMAR027025 [Perkinsus marinus ATCC 50983]
MSDESGGSLIFHQQQQTLSISIRLDICVATAYNVPYHVTPIPGSNGQLWIVPDYSSTNFATKLDSCNDAIVRSVQFRRLRASSEGGSMNEVTASMVGGEDWVFGLTGAPPQPPAYPTRSPATPAHGTHPVGTYESSERSDSVSTIEFYEDLLLMSLTIKLGSCTASVQNIPYHIGRVRNHEGHYIDDKLYVGPDFSETDFTTQVDNCRDSNINGDTFQQLFVSSEQGVPMSEITTHGTFITEWRFQLRGIPARPPPTTPLPTTPTPTVPTKPHPSGLYEDDSRGGSSVLVFLQKPGNFTMDITLGGCRLYYEDVPYEMVEENGASWVKPDYSSTSLAYALNNCRFNANSRYELNDLENIEFHDAQDPNDQTLVVYRMLETYGKALRTVFKNQ